MVVDIVIVYDAKEAKLNKFEFSQKENLIFARYFYYTIYIIVKARSINYYHFWLNAKFTPEITQNFVLFAKQFIMYRFNIASCSFFAFSASSRQDSKRFIDNTANVKKKLYHSSTEVVMSFNPRLWLRPSTISTSWSWLYKR
jgi:hypothetical protein